MRMPEYFDSTVAFSAIFADSTRYGDAVARIKAAGEDRVIINHGFAEVYRTLTGRFQIAPKQAVKLVEGMARLFKEAVFDRSDYLAAIKNAAENALSGAIIYDVVHAEAARKVGASKVHTYNSAHFSRVAPDLNIV
jgi:predicted nucleic acid-binding protein